MLSLVFLPVIQQVELMGWDGMGWCPSVLQEPEFELLRVNFSDILIRIQVIWVRVNKVKNYCIVGLKSKRN